MGLTVQELHYDFNLMSDEIGGNDRRSFSSPEIDWLLNRAQDALMNQQVDMFELNSKRTHDLMPLHVKQPLQPGIVATLHPDRIKSINGDVYVYELPIDTNAFVLPYFSFTKIAAVTISAGCEYRAIAQYMDNDDFEEALKSSLELSETSIFVNMGRSTSLEGRSIFIYSLYPIKDNIRCNCCSICSND